MEVLVSQVGDVQFEANARGHRVLCDQPAENGGRDEGMTPPEFLLTALGTCAAYYAAQYLKTRSLSHTGIQVKVEADKASAPARLGSFRIEVLVAGLEPAHEAGVLRAVKACLIHNSLLHTPSIEAVVTSVPASTLHSIDSGVGNTAGTRH
jgi:uncharacterized OsmC-like protein